MPTLDLLLVCRKLFKSNFKGMSHLGSGEGSFYAISILRDGGVGLPD
jgi:hypothetical protein